MNNSKCACAQFKIQNSKFKTLLLIVQDHWHTQCHYLWCRIVGGDYYGVVSIEQLHSYGVRRNGVDAGLEGSRL